MNKKSKLLICMIILLSVLGCRSSNFLTDQVHNTDKAEESIKMLKDGILIVRLYMENDKIQLLRKTIDQPNTKEKNRNILRRELEKTIERRDENNRKLIDEIAADYDFSEFMIIPDSSFKEFLDGKRKGIFFNEQLNLDKTLALETDNYLIYGTYEDKFIVLDKDGTLLPTPFPVRPYMPFFQGIKYLFSGAKPSQISLLNEELHRYYGKVVSKRR